MLDCDVVWLTVGIYDLEIQHLDVGVASVQPDRLEATFPAPDPYRVAVIAKKINLLAAELRPIIAFDYRRWTRRATEAPQRFAKDLNHRLAAKVGPRAVDHLDLLEVAPLAAKIERQLLALPDEPLNT